MDLNRGNDSLLPHGDVLPEVASSAWVAPGAFVVGDVRLGEDSSVWYGAVLRGDTEPIRIGARTNVQDGCLIGMGATVLNGAKIGAGAVVPEGREFPPCSLIVGIPARRVGEVTEEQARDVERGAREYVERATAHRNSLKTGERRDWSAR